MTPTKLFAMIWTFLLGLSLYTTVWLMLSTAHSADGHPMPLVRSRTRLFEKARHARHKQFVSSNIDQFPPIDCPKGEIRGHDQKCYPIWR